MCSQPEAPPAPDYAGAAQAQGAANLEAARASAMLSNPNITNPYGTRTVRYEDDVPYVTETLSPEGQALFETQQRISGQLGNIAESGLGRLQSTFATPFEIPDTSQVTENILARTQPMFDRERAALENDLLVRGFNPGTTAYQQRMDDLARRENDFRLAAALAAGQEQSRQAQLGAFERNMPLSELNALRTGSQPVVPQFQAISGQQVGAAPVFDAAMAQNAAAQQAYANQLAGAGGLFDIGGSLLGAAGSAGGFGKLFF